MRGREARNDGTKPKDGIGERVSWREKDQLEQLKTRPKVRRAQGLVCTNTDLVLSQESPQSITLNFNIQYLFKYFCI